MAKMTKKEWQKYHGFDDQDMEFIVQAVDMFNGTVTRIETIDQRNKREAKDRKEGIERILKYGFEN